MNAMIIDPKDNVAVAIEPIAAGTPVTYLAQGKTVCLTAAEDITIYHKLATRVIPAGEPVVKYGENIGVATADIPAGAHVHVHNVTSMKEDRRSKE
jgi:altronate dehydratase small subunit